MQTPGHKRDLGIELDVTLYFQSKDGALNDDPDKMGGFFTMLQYGVLFPHGGLGYQDSEATQDRRTLPRTRARRTRAPRRSCAGTWACCSEVGAAADAGFVLVFRSTKPRDRCDRKQAGAGLAGFRDPGLLGRS